MKVLAFSVQCKSNGGHTRVQSNSLNESSTVSVLLQHCIPGTVMLGFNNGAKIDMHLYMQLRELNTAYNSRLSDHSTGLDLAWTSSLAWMAQKTLFPGFLHASVM